MQGILMKENYQKSRSKSMRKSKNRPTTENKINFKDAEDLQKEYDTMLRSIEEDSCESIRYIISGSDMKFYLEQNDLDYQLFKVCIHYQKPQLVK